jgi:hypothetical protein
MEPVSRLNKLLEVLRQKQATTQSDKTTGSNRSESASKSETGKTGATHSRDIEKLKSAIKSRLKSLPSEDIQSDKAHAIFLEAVLTWEFGMDLLNDPEFYTLVNDLKDSMSQDDSLKQKIDSTLKELVNS